MAKIVGMDKQPTQSSIDITKSTAVACVACGDDCYVPAMKFRKLSKLLTGNPKDVIIPIEVYMCAGCGEINQELLPDELKGLK